MTKFKNRYRIESNRLQYWDYSASGRYFITICVENNECILGVIKNGEMIVSEYGEIVRKEILKMNEYHIRALVDEWVVMPNHIHLLIVLKDDEECDRNGEHHVEKIHEFSLQQQPSPTEHQWWYNINYKPSIDEIKQYRKYRRRMIIPKMIGKLQMQTSKQMNIIRNTPGMKNWQSNYHDHIIRNDESYQHIKNYIINNPVNWDEETLT